ncbi:hypothetical protein [Acetivibrio clariflavus]|uniref:Uncharacterized protein n=1 Tax=Acetivibrio clariflavus (strain DSM 19732 / NBRC 101661 / EBR45) TaxID=720554 RepID=G8LUR2_ACECE|nr:hypothetical protein [Acetivibrio clariflavus]AEV67402.1 hypothetical protein Clocl_0697 [Acetivibrio clariflavus DSM 19732]
MDIVNAKTPRQLPDPPSLERFVADVLFEGWFDGTYNNYVKTSRCDLNDHIISFNRSLETIKASGLIKEAEDIRESANTAVQEAAKHFYKQGIKDAIIYLERMGVIKKKSIGIINPLEGYFNK